MAVVPLLSSTDDDDDNDESLRWITGLEVTHIDWHSLTVPMGLTDGAGNQSHSLLLLKLVVVVEIPSHTAAAAATPRYCVTDILLLLSAAVYPCGGQNSLFATNLTHTHSRLARPLLAAVFHQIFPKTFRLHLVSLASFSPFSLGIILDLRRFSSGFAPLECSS